jgi:hypothetical protein
MCGVFECDRGAWIMKLWPTRACCGIKISKDINKLYYDVTICNETACTDTSSNYLHQGRYAHSNMIHRHCYSIISRIVLRDITVLITIRSKF